MNTQITKLLTHMLRPQQSSVVAVRDDVLWLLGLGLLLMGAGLGLRDPWPADEPRFALIAWDMVRTQQWLIPMIGGDTYADKPPLFFWLIALVLKLTGSLRIAFLLPSLCAALATLVLVYDLARRLWNREVGLTAGLLLLGTVQFVWQGRQAQIDACLCFWVTLSLYGLLRHLLLGPAWRWYAIGWAAAGLGVITKGVGFLSLLVLLPWVVLRDATWSPRPVIQWGWRWIYGPLAFVAAVSIWLLPMLLSAMNDPALAAYRDEILFHQTVHRYAHAWHHIEPFWYFFGKVIPPLWLPLSALLPWLIPYWRAAWRARDLRIALLLSWVGLVLLFFSMSPGKRGVYILPALPMLACLSAPCVQALLTRQGPRRVFWWLTAAIALLCLGVVGYLLFVPTLRIEVHSEYGIDPLWPLLSIAGVGVMSCILLCKHSAVLAYGATIACILLIVGFWISPAINAARSGAAWVQHAEQLTQAIPQLGLVGYKEQFLLHFKRPTFNFGHSRWREANAEADDAAAWLMAGSGRALLIHKGIKQRCFAAAEAKAVGVTAQWWLVMGQADAACVARGNAAVARLYQP